MRIERHTLTQVLRDKGGISASIPDVLGGVGLKLVVITAVGGVLAAGLGMWAVSSSSADASAGFQAANVSFESAVRSSDVVVGVGTDRVGLLKDVSGSRCEVQAWQSGTRDGVTVLRVDTEVVDGVCTPTTPLPAFASVADSTELLYDIAVPTFEYANVGAREIVFDANAVPTLASGSKPAAVKTADWKDVRPHKVQMTLETRREDASFATKRAVATGFTNVVNVSAAADDLRYVPAPSSDPVPGPVTITDIERSTSAGLKFAGLREGVRVTFIGAVCPSGPSKVVVSFQSQSPTTDKVVDTVINKVVDGGATVVDLAGVANGATGEVTVVVTCIDGGLEETKSASFSQALPSPVLTVDQGDNANIHALSWTAVSSLPTSFQVNKTAAEGTQHAKPAATTALRLNLTYQAGTNYGNKTTYGVTATVGDMSSDSSNRAITTAWPDTPTAQNISYTRTGSGRYQGGDVKWGYDMNCPTGTGTQTRVRENRTGQADGTTSTDVRATSDWGGRMTVYNWSPSYSRQGYRYGVQVQTVCRSSVTGLESTTNSAIGYWITPMERPDKPVWDGYNLKDRKRGTNWTYSTSLSGTEKSIVADYTSSCPTGSKLGWTTYTARDWLGDRYIHEWGWSGYWKLQNRTPQDVIYGAARYECDTPWTTSPQSAVSDNKTVEVRWDD